MNVIDLPLLFDDSTGNCTILHDRSACPGLHIDLCTGLCRLPDQFAVEDLSVKDIPNLVTRHLRLKKHREPIRCNKFRTLDIRADPLWIRREKVP